MHEQDFILPDFPALREFFRGYLHEDWREEHESLEAAVGQFCRDAGEHQRQEVSRQWQTFRKRTEDLPLNQIRELLARSLGSAWYPASQADLETLSRALDR
jgi:hypothetical protein